MHQLDIDSVLIKVPTRILGKSSNALARELIGGFLEIMVELGGVQYVCTTARTTSLADALSALEENRDEESSEADNSKWRELTRNHEVVDRYIALSAYSRPSSKGTLAITAIGLDPDDKDNYFIDVIG